MKLLPLRTVLPADLVDQVEIEAARRGVPVERLVEQALRHELPRLWAFALRLLVASDEASDRRLSLPKSDAG